jgi:hypothetical protein
MFQVKVLNISVQYSIGWSRNRVFFYFAIFENGRNKIIISRELVIYRKVSFRENFVTSLVFYLEKLNIKKSLPAQDKTHEL